MFHILFTIWLSAVGTVTAHASDSSSVAADGAAAKTERTIAAGPMSSRTMERAPAMSVVSLRRLPDGSLVQQCNVVSAQRTGGEMLRPRGEWIQVSEEQVR